MEISERAGYSVYLGGVPCTRQPCLGREPDKRSVFPRLCAWVRSHPQYRAHKAKNTTSDNYQRCNGFQNRVGASESLSGGNGRWETTSLLSGCAVMRMNRAKKSHNHALITSMSEHGPQACTRLASNPCWHMRQRQLRATFLLGPMGPTLKLRGLGLFPCACAPT